jgi:hypothetical protein
MNENAPAVLFVWRGHRNLSDDRAFEPWLGWRYTCAFCREPLVLSAVEDREAGIVGKEEDLYSGLAQPYDEDMHEDALPIMAGGGSSDSYYVCPLCGWIFVHRDIALYGMTGQERFGSSLRDFDLSSAEIGLDELGTHLRRRYSDVYALSWQKFEDIVADVLRRAGKYMIVQTARTADGGADILLLSEDGSCLSGVVECKRYARERTIGVDLIRQIVGVCVDWQVRDATIVTSSAFTSGAYDLAERFGESGFHVDLVAAQDFLNALKVYNAALPPLDAMSSEFRADFIAHNREALRNSIVIPPERHEDTMTGNFRFIRSVKRYQRE